jgi:hypothetical protein
VTGFSFHPRAHTTTISIPVGYLTKIVGIPDGEIGGEPRGYLSGFGRKAESRCTIDCRRQKSLGRAHPELAHGERQDERKVVLISVAIAPATPASSIVRAGACCCLPRNSIVPGNRVATVWDAASEVIPRGEIAAR